MFAMFGIGPMELLLLVAIIAIAAFVWSKARGK